LIQTSALPCAFSFGQQITEQQTITERWKKQTIENTKQKIEKAKETIK
jgi:hypothetical protein